MRIDPLVRLGRLPGPVRLLLAGTLINRLGTFILPYLTLVLSRDLGLGPGATAGLVVAYGVGSIVALLAGGVLSDRLGRRRTLVASLLGSGTLAVAMAPAPGVKTFLALLVAYSFLADLYRPSATAVLADRLPPAERAVGFAAYRMVANLGFAGGMALGGLLADRSWRLLFVADGLTSALFGVLVLLRLPESRPCAPEGAAGSARIDATAPAPSGVFRDTVFLQLAFATLLFSILLFSHATAFPLTVTQAGYPARTFGLLVGVNGLLIALFEVSVVARLGRFRRLRVAALGSLLNGVGFALTGLVLHWAWFLPCVVLWTAGEILTAPQVVAFLADWSPVQARGRYLGVFQATWSTALTLNPVLLLPLQARLAPALFWGLLLLPAIPAAVIFLRLDRRADRPELLRGTAS